MREIVSKGTLKHLMREYNLQVSDDVLIYLQDYVEMMLHERIKFIEACHDERNRQRESTDLPKIRKVQLSDFTVLVDTK